MRKGLQTSLQEEENSSSSSKMDDNIEIKEDPEIHLYNFPNTYKSCLVDYLLSLHSNCVERYLENPNSNWYQRISIEILNLLDNAFKIWNFVESTNLKILLRTIDQIVKMLYKCRKGRIQEIFLRILSDPRNF